jgi:hypothetical protein
VLNNKLTGQIQIAFLNGRTTSVFVQRGMVRSLYLRNKRMPDLNWDVPVARFGWGTLEIEPLPARLLMFRKVIIEEILPPKPIASGTNQLRSMFNLAEHNLNPTLFHIQWEKAEAFVLVAGGYISIRHAVLIAPSGTAEENMALDQILTWDEPRCNVLVYRGDIKNQAWLELHLNIMVEWYGQKMLRQYQQLTGAVMVRSILQSLSVMAETKGWNITTQNQQLQDASVFPDAAEAGHAYREMLSAIRSRIEPIIGSSLTQYLIKQSMEPTTGVYKTIQETFSLIEEAR